ncbi:MAG: glycosyltransferase family 4 protein [Candidatus Woesebacteria bacterium]|nr:glycosyltransferase family 4 protein [Candidatus Woesebacteria bacterium]
MKIWFVSTRIIGNDGVSLEAVRWRTILERMGHKVTFVAGELDRTGILIPELFFGNPKVVELHDKVVFSKNNFKEIEAEVFELAGKIEGKLREAFNGHKPDLLIIANCLSLPMHFPLAVALTRIVDEYKIATIARHHDFWWERKRFLKSSCFPFFKRWFPPVSPYIKHVTINSIAQKELKEKIGIDSVIIPDTFDYQSTKNKKDLFNKSFRKDFDISKDDVVFLQATRIIPRKRIEIAIKLVKKLDNPRIVLVIVGRAGDEGREYKNKLYSLVKKLKVRVIFAGDYVNFHRKITGGRRKIYTLWDAFVASDYVTYPSEVEGFGNQYIEAVYFKKPVIITPYPVYESDIRLLGFKSIEITEKLTKKDIELINSYLVDKEKVNKIVESNFKLGKKYFSYEATGEKIKKLLNSWSLR